LQAEISVRDPAILAVYVQHVQGVRDVVFLRAVGEQFRFGPVPFGDERPALRRIGEGVFGPLPFFYGKLDLVFVLVEDVRVNAGHML